MSDKPSILGLLGPVIAAIPPEGQRLFAALGERIAATRYRAWADASEDASMRKVLEACAAREEVIAGRVESLDPNAAAVQEQLQKDHAEIVDQYFALFDGWPLAEQFAMQAEAERAGAGAWRAYADAADAANNEEEAKLLRSCAPLEEENADALDQLIEQLNTRS